MVKVFAVALVFNSMLGGNTLRCWVLLIASVVVTLFTSVGLGYVIFQGVMALAS